MSSLRDQLLSVRAEFGKLTAETLVEAAMPEDHPLHARFEWDDSIAGPAYRKVQAQQLIRQVRIQQLPREGDGPPVDVRAFHAVYTAESGHTYEPAEEVVADPILRSILLRDMERDWRNLKARYDSFTEFWAIVRSDIEQAV